MTDTPAPKDAPRDFFISYATPDGAWAEWVAWILEENGYTVHLQAWDFLPGKNFALEMQKGATECDRTIAILSDNYLAADFIQPEWAAAFSQDPQSKVSRLISIRVSDCKPTGLLKPIIYIDTVGKAEADAERSILEGIAAALKKRGKPEVRPGFPSPPQAQASALQNLAAQDREDPLSRFALFRALSALTAPELSQLVFVLKPPAGVMPSEAAPGGDRVSALLNWAESSTGRGLGEVQSLLRKILPATEHRVAEHNVFPGWVQTQNPFLPLNGVVEKPEQSFNSESTLSRIFELLNSGSSVALIGERNIGKSSMLRAVQREAEERLYTFRQTVLIELNKVYSENDFYSALCEAANIQTCSGRELDRALNSKRLLLLLDELERISQENFSRRVREQLRGLAEGSDAPIKLVVAASTPLRRLFPDSHQEGMVSPFEDICIEEQLKPWSPQVVRAFIATRLAPTPVRFSDYEIAGLIATCGGRPKDLMQQCNALFRQKLTP